MLTIFTVAITSYILGSIPTSIIVSKLLKGIDIRDYGSKNAGATNVYRTLGIGPAVFVSLIDVAKGAVCVLWVAKISLNLSPLDPDLLEIIGGVAVICGHIWTIFARFKGGKAVNTALGVMLALSWVSALICLLVWIVVTFSTRYVSLGSISAALSLPLVVATQKFTLKMGLSDELFIFTCLSALLIVAAHRSNIGRLIKGQENRFGRKREQR